MVVKIYPQEERACKHIEAASGAIEVEEEYGKIEGEIEDVRYRMLGWIVVTGDDQSNRDDAEVNDHLVLKMAELFIMIRSSQERGR